VRPVGEPEHPGIRGAEGQLTGMWNYSPMQFDDHSILYILNETDDGQRVLEEAIRIWNDGRREPEWLGRPEYDHRLTPGTRMIEHSTIAFPDAPGGRFSVTATPLLTAFIAIGTGYGMDADWRHGQGPSSSRASRKARGRSASTASSITSPADSAKSASARSSTSTVSGAHSQYDATLSGACSARRACRAIAGASGASEAT
jgi:hypothetical protein